MFEHCLYDDDGQLLNGNLMDYLVPMAGEMPDIDIGHVVTPTADSELGAKGAGEAGTAGAPACVMNAVNDALRPLGAAPITAMPITPERVLEALRRHPEVLGAKRLASKSDGHPVAKPTCISCAVATPSSIAPRAASFEARFARTSG